jgi:hypothetical protein
MADSQAFEWVCGELERSTSLDRLQARGTLRLALKEAGLEARSVTAAQIDAVVRQVLPGELRARGVQEEAAICENLAASLVAAELEGESSGAESPEEVFRRLGGS